MAGDIRFSDDSSTSRKRSGVDTRMMCPEEDSTSGDMQEMRRKTPGRAASTMKPAAAVKAVQPIRQKMQPKLLLASNQSSRTGSCLLVN
jgi:hypothetical protein